MLIWWIHLKFNSGTCSVYIHTHTHVKVQTKARLNLLLRNWIMTGCFILVTRAKKLSYHMTNFVSCKSVRLLLVASCEHANRVWCPIPTASAFNLVIHFMLHWRNLGPTVLFFQTHVEFWFQTFFYLRVGGIWQSRAKEILTRAGDCQWWCSKVLLWISLTFPSPKFLHVKMVSTRAGWVFAARKYVRNVTTIKLSEVSISRKCSWISPA